MSYNKVRNTRGISEKRMRFGSAGFSDVTASIDARDLGGGSFFCTHADVPENGNALSLNLCPHGCALETRADVAVHKNMKARRRIELTDMLWGMDTSRLHAVGNVSVGAGGAGFLVTCNFFAPEGEPYKDPGVYVTKKLEAGDYLFRLYLGGDVCPKIKIYESTDKVNYEGKPSVVAYGGKRYVQAEFAAEKTVRIELTYENTGADTVTRELERLVLINTSAAVELGMPESKAKNTLFSGGSTVWEDETDIPTGEDDAAAFGGGRYAFKRGAGLYTVEAKSGECFLEYPLMPMSDACTIYRRGDGFIAVCENGVTVTTSDTAPGMGAKKGEVYTPLCYYIYNPEGDTEYQAIEGLNLFNGYFYVKLLLGGAASGFLPEHLLIDGGFCEAYDPETMRRLPEGEVTLEASEYGGGRVTEDSACYGILVKLRLRSDGEEGAKIEKCRSLLFSPDGSEAFPQADGSSAVVLYADKELIVCPLGENMYAPESRVLRAENTEKITSVLKYSENFLVFSPHYIRKMVISEGDDGSKMLSMQNFKYDIGCDMPGSAVLAGDKIVYAHSRAGVFYIDRFGFTQRDMSRHVSANIEDGENGFFACSDADISAAEAAVCDGKYFLRIGEYFYVWDFSHAVPTGNEKASEERKLRWFMYSGVNCRKILGADSENIYFLTSNSDFAALGRGTSQEASVESYFRSKGYDIAPFGGASVYKLSLSLASKHPCTVRLYFDGEDAGVKYTALPSEDGKTLCIVRPAARKCRKFAFSVHSFGAMRIDGYKIEYLPE